MVQAGRILIADDDDVFRESLSDVLQRSGYECECVSDADQAAERLKTHSYDLLISDIQMPGNPELELILELPRLARGMPAILVTGYPSLESAIESVQLPVAAYLVKPLKIQELLAHVQGCIEHYRAYQAVRSIYDRLRDWQQDMQAVEQWLSRSRVDPSQTSLSRVVDLTLSNMISSLMDLRRVSEPIIASAGAVGETEAGAEEPLNALKEAIDVLRRTKSSFKSKQLAKLRHRLEHVVEETESQKENSH